MLSLVRLLVWGALWVVAWIATTLVRTLQKRPRMDNCLTWAIRKWDRDGGYLVIRWCRSAKYSWMRWPHFLWLSSDDHLHLRHLMPKQDDQHTRIVPKMWFEGKVRVGDHPNELEN